MKKKLSKAELKRRRAAADQKRIVTMRAKYGPKWFTENAKKARSQSPATFTSESSQAANKARWDRYRAEQAKRRQKGDKDGSIDS
jgi:hypothetical protein